VRLRQGYSCRPLRYRRPRCAEAGGISHAALAVINSYVFSFKYRTIEEWVDESNELAGQGLLDRPIVSDQARLAAAEILDWDSILALDTALDGQQGFGDRTQAGVDLPALLADSIAGIAGMKYFAALQALPITRFMG
jgi:hypothetical protein